MPTEPVYKKHLAYLKDFVYIITILSGLFLYVRANGENKAILETTVKQNTETLQKMEIFLEKQATLNGQFIQFMAMDIHD